MCTGIRHHSSIKTPLPKIHHNSSQQQRPNAFIFQRTINTLTTSSVLTFLWPPFSKQFRLLFPPDFVSPPPSPRVGGRLMKGCSQRNMGETYHGVSQPSHREASYEKFRVAAAVATRELPSVIKPPQVQANAPVCLFAILCFFSHSSVPDIITVLSIFSPLPPAWSLLLSSEPYFPYSLLSSNLISISFFPSLRHVFFMSGRASFDPD